jgi:hypothetical protein
MGFFKKLFRRKKGGTFFGNLIRGVTNKFSGGILGQGQDLAKWEQKEYDKQVRNDIRKSNAFIKGQSIAQPYADKLNNTQVVKDAKLSLAMSWLKKYRWHIGIPAVIVVGYLVYNKMSSRPNYKRRR